MYQKLPRVESTQQERIEALRVGREVLGEKQIFRQGGVDPTPLLRVAEYVTTGHDYFDTHPPDPDPAESRDGDDEEDEEDFGL